MLNGVVVEHEIEVSISLEHYTELTEKAFLADMILDALYDNASLNYDGSELSFTAFRINDILKYGDSGIYHERYIQLKAKKLLEDRDAIHEEVNDFIAKGKESVEEYLGKTIKKEDLE